MYLIQRSNYELFNCNNFNIRYWSWNYRGCWPLYIPSLTPTVILKTVVSLSNQFVRQHSLTRHPYGGISTFLKLINPKIDKPTPYRALRWLDATLAHHEINPMGLPRTRLCCPQIRTQFFTFRRPVNGCLTDTPHLVDQGLKMVNQKTEYSINSSTAKNGHNKSKSMKLSLLTLNEEELNIHWKNLLAVAQNVEGPIEESPCLYTNSKDGRYSYKQKKIFFGYQLAAWSRFGRNALENVPSFKTDPEHLTISHICGNGPRCIKTTHLLLETKRINDQRVHCHFCIKNVFRIGNHQSLRMLLALGICSHFPMCCTI